MPARTASTHPEATERGGCSYDTRWRFPTGSPVDVFAGSYCGRGIWAGIGTAEAGATFSGQDRTHRERFDARLSQGRGSARRGSKRFADPHGRRWVRSKQYIRWAYSDAEL